jgi:hypothetical protein
LAVTADTKRLDAATLPVHRYAPPRNGFKRASASLITSAKVQLTLASLITTSKVE